MIAKRLLTYLAVAGLGFAIPEVAAQTRARIQIGDDIGGIDGKQPWV